MTNKELINKIYFEGQIEGTEDGLYIRYNGKECTVRFNNDDIRNYIGTDVEGEELLDLYQVRDEEVHYVIKADQRDNFVDHNCDLDWCEIERV
ncbi:MAG: hypothetical protein PT956_03425 [Firmicutes bacterium]|nr:hypothetical protein [Bacillota bacterium]